MAVDRDRPRDLSASQLAHCGPAAAEEPSRYSPADTERRRQSSSAVPAVSGRPLGPRPFGLSVEDCARLGGREGPRAERELGLELTGRPARVANEDPQTFHRLVAAEQLAQQFLVGAEVDGVE